LVGKIIFEDGTTSNFVAGDTLTFANASAIDLNGNGNIEYVFELEQAGTFDHQAELIQNHSFVVEALKIKGGYDGVLGRWAGSTTPLSLIDETFKTETYDVFDDTFAFALTDQLSLSVPLVA